MLKSFIKPALFVLLSSQILYLLIHLQFLLGMPQAGLAVYDALYFLALGIGFYTLSKGNKKLYFISYAVVLWPTVQLQYFYIKIFNKPFTLSEMEKFTTLLQVSPLPMKLLYGSLFILWVSGIVYMSYHYIKNWIGFGLIKKSVPFLVVAFCYYIMTKPIHVSKHIDGYTEMFYTYGIVAMHRYTEPDRSIELSQDMIENAFHFLRKKESQRADYPIHLSPDTAPDKKRPIVMIVFESFSGLLSGLRQGLCTCSVKIKND